MSETTPIACPECDLLGEIGPMKPGDQAKCGRCGCVLSICFEDPYARASSFAIAALVLLIISLSLPFLSMSAAGVSNAMTLMQTVSYLALYGADGIAFLVFVFVILVPVVMLVFIVVLSAALGQGWFHRLLRPPARWLFHLNGWSMVEVFAIGVIVSLVKLASMAEVSLGPAFWAYLVFAVLFLLAYSAVDRWTLWRDIEWICGETGG